MTLQQATMQRRRVTVQPESNTGSTNIQSMLVYSEQTRQICKTGSVIGRCDQWWLYNGDISDRRFNTLLLITMMLWVHINTYKLYLALFSPTICASWFWSKPPNDLFCTDAHVFLYYYLPQSVNQSAKVTCGSRWVSILSGSIVWLTNICRLPSWMWMLLKYFVHQASNLLLILVRSYTL